MKRGLPLIFVSMALITAGCVQEAQAPEEPAATASALQPATTSTPPTATTTSTTSSTTLPSDGQMREGAVQARNPLKCMPITRFIERVDCIKDVAAGLKDARVCGMLDEGSHINDCIIRVAGEARNRSICDRANVTFLGRCLKQVAVLSENPELCNSINDSTVKYGCLTETALRYSSQKYCGMIGDAGRRSECYFRLASESGSVDLCRRIINDSNLEDQCKTNVAVRHGQHLECVAVENSSMEDSCMMKVAAATRNELPCMFIVDPRKEATCNALASRSLRHCEIISPKRDKWWHDYCVRETNATINRG